MKQKDLKDKAISFKGKDYVLVKDRVAFFNEEFDNGSIKTQILVSDGKRVEVKAVVTPDVEKPARMFYGHSQAVIGEGYINKTSALENAETSAVGRALAFMGIGVLDSIASADEMVKSGVKPLKNGRRQEEDTEDEEVDTEEEEDDSEEESEDDGKQEPARKEIKLTAKELSMIKPITQLLKNAVTESELEAAKAAAGAAKRSLSNRQLNYLIKLFKETEARLENE